MIPLDELWCKVYIMNQIQKALFINALFSGVSGIILITFHSAIASLFSVENTSVFWIIGIALIYFTATILFEWKRQKQIGILLIIAQDILWVFGSLILLIFQPFTISTNGNWVIGIIAFIVLLMAINQSYALKRSKINS